MLNSIYQMFFIHIFNKVLKQIMILFMDFQKIYLKLIFGIFFQFLNINQ